MTSLILLPTTSDAFSEYRPSKNAHIDILPSSLGKRRDSTVRPDEDGPRVVKLNINTRPSEPSVKDQLSHLLSAIAPLLSGESTTHSYHHLSSTCHRLVLPPHSEGCTMYDRVKGELERSVAGLARQWRASILSKESGWLGILVRGWKTWESRVGLLSSVFVYLDRVYSNEANGVGSIRELSIEAFRKGIWENDLLFGKTRDDLLSWATSERETAAPNTELRPTISSLAHLAKLLSIFSTLSTPYFDFTNSHYADTAVSNISSVEAGTMSATRYIEWTLQKVEEESERAYACLSSEVAEKVVEIARGEAGQKMGTRIVRRAVDEAMDAMDAPALAHLYRFSVDVDVFSIFTASLHNHIEDRLRKLISDPANDPQMIEGTLNLKRFADKAVTGLFSTKSADRPLMDEEMAVPGDMEVPIEEALTILERKKRIELEDTSRVSFEADMGSRQKKAVPADMDAPVEKVLTIPERRRQIELEDTIRVGLKAGMGSRQNAPAEWIAKHLDGAMRRGQGSGTEAEFNALLDEIIALIGFTKDKDVFKAFYSTQLAKRLLLSKSASDDMERNMILKLQQEMGEEFTSGDTMMKDLQLSETLVKSYHSTQAKNPDDFRDAGNFTANVLTESAWPAYPLLKDGWSFKLTPDLQASIDAFTTWYSTQHKNRQLSWRWQLATVTLSARFASGKYEIGVSLFQAVVMLQFSDEDSFDFKELRERTGIESSELIRTLQSLSLGRKGTRVLLKKPPGKEVHPTDIFAFNRSFTSDRIKFRINQIQQDMSAEESRKTNEQVAIDRVSVLEATIVRIMKARKKMTLQLLIDAVVTDVNKRFPPDVKEIKKRMESLIEREFLMRDEDDRNLLHYLA